MPALARQPTRQRGLDRRRVDGRTAGTDSMVSQSLEAEAGARPKVALARKALLASAGVPRGLPSRRCVGSLSRTLGERVDRPAAHYHWVVHAVVDAALLRGHCAVVVKLLAVGTRMKQTA